MNILISLCRPNTAAHKGRTRHQQGVDEPSTQSINERADPQTHTRPLDQRGVHTCGYTANSVPDMPKIPPHLLPRESSCTYISTLRQGPNSNRCQSATPSRLQRLATVLSYGPSIGYGAWPLCNILWNISTRPLRHKASHLARYPGREMRVVSRPEQKYNSCGRQNYPQLWPILNANVLRIWND